MAEIIHIAECILNERGALATMKLQKLVFYAQVRYLTAYGSPLFEDDFEAWTTGPVTRRLYDLHSGRFVLTSGFFGNACLEENPYFHERELRTIQHVLNTFGNYTGKELCERVQSERPWVEARRGVGPTERGGVISKNSILAFYSQAENTGRSL